MQEKLRWMEMVTAMVGCPGSLARRRGTRQAPRVEAAYTMSSRSLSRQP